MIESTVLRVDDETCDRCGETVDAVRTAAEELTVALAPLNVRVTLVEHAATADEIESSNSVMINGRPIEEWLGAERITTDCPSCGDLLGTSTCCAAVRIGDKVQESFTVEQVKDAAISALGVVDVGGCC
ncbi:MAG: DUF2703 domain-containing protein [Actinomycetota bacterium]